MTRTMTVKNLTRKMLDTLVGSQGNDQVVLTSKDSEKPVPKQKTEHCAEQRKGTKDREQPITAEYSGPEPGH